MNKDAYGRFINYLRISVTDRCNLRCFYCMPQEGIPLFPYDEILTYEEILKVVEASTKIGINTVRVTGGEPLIRKNLTYLIEKISSINEIKDLAMTTNGILLLSFLPELKRAGLKRVNISLDTLKKDRFERITKRDGLKDVLAAIEKSLEMDMLPVKINMVVIKDVNDDEILDFALLTKDKPIHVRFIEYMPWGVKEYWDKEKVIKANDIKMTIEKNFGLLEHLDKPAHGPSQNYRIRGFLGEIGFINPISDHFCGSCNRIRLTADGKLRLCLFSEKEINIKKELRKGIPLDEIAKIIREAIFSKPEKQEMLNHLIYHNREMNQIGG